MDSAIRRHITGVSIAVLGLAGTASADLTVRYRAVHSELVLFGQKQESPFGRVQYTIQIKENRLRTEMTDHFGRRLWLIADRATGKAFGLDPEARTWWVDAGVWTCAEIPTQVARGAAQLLSAGGIQDLQVSTPEAVVLSGTRAHKVDVQFEGRVLGAPKPVDARLALYFADDEGAKFGPGAAGDLYCGSKPSREEWSRAFTRFLGLPEQQAQAMARVVGLPLQIDLATDLGLGQATVTLAVDDISAGELPDDAFRIPADFAERK